MWPGPSRCHRSKPPRSASGVAGPAPSTQRPPAPPGRATRRGATAGRAAGPRSGAGRRRPCCPARPAAAVGSGDERGRQGVGRPPPGASSARWWGTRLKPMPRSCRKMPVSGSTMWAPQPGAFDWTASRPCARGRPRSTRWCRPRRPAARSARRGIDQAAAGVEAGGVDQPRAVGAVVEQLLALAARHPGRLGEQVRPGRVGRGRAARARRRGRRWRGSGRPATGWGTCTVLAHKSSARGSSHSAWFTPRSPG